MKKSLWAAAALVGALALLAAVTVERSTEERSGGVITLYRSDPPFEAEWRPGAVPVDRWIGFVFNDAGWDGLGGLLGGRPLPVERPDFTRDVALVAYMGEQRTGGYRIHVTEVSVPAGGKLRIGLAVDSPDPSEFVIQAFTYPVDVVLLERESWPADLLARLETDRLDADVLDQDGRDWGPVRIAGRREETGR